MRTSTSYEKHLKEKLKDPKFKKMYFKECRKLEFDLLVKDLCSVAFRSKSKTRERLQRFLIKRYAHYPELRFDLKNGITLCRGCHKLTDNYKNKKVQYA